MVISDRLKTIIFIILFCELLTPVLRAGENCAGFTTYTPGAWGASNGIAAQLRNESFTAIFPDGLTLGGSNKLKFTSSLALELFLPAGGNAGTLISNYIDPLYTSAGVFAGHVTTLALNVYFDAAGKIGNNNNYQLGELLIVNGPFANMTVLEFLALANLALGGGSTGGFTILQLNDAAAALNENFDNGIVDNGYLTCPGMTAKVGDRVWYDLNKNGIQDTGENGVPNITVKLYDCNNTLAGTTSTNSTGYYLFDNLSAGEYYVYFVIPGGYEFSPKDQGGDDALDSDADPLTGKTVCFNLSSGEEDLTRDAGIYECNNSLGDFIWHDRNVNGIQDPNEEGIEGVLVELVNNSGGVIQSSSTNNQGLYAFTNFPNGTYTVRIAASNFNAGGVLYSSTRVKWYASPKDEGSDDTKDSDGDITNHTASAVISCMEDPTIDFGFYKTCVSILKTGPQSVQAGDVIEFQFTIENCGDVLLAGGVDVIDSLLNPSGNHIIANKTVIPGEVWTFTKTYTTTANDCGELLNKAQAVGHPKLPNGTYLANISDNSQWIVNVICNNSSLGDRVWEDLNKNGIQDLNEPGVQDVVIKLYECNDNLLSTKTTNSSGYYLFDNLLPGSYYVKFDLPSGFVFTFKDQGINDTLDSDADVSTGKTICTDIAAGENDLTWDAGIYMPLECVIDWTGYLGPDSAICLYEPQWVIINATVNLTPNPSKAKVQTSWRIVHPHELDTSYNYNSFWIYQDTTFQFKAWWPGISCTDSIVEIHYGLNILDCDGNPIHNGIGRDLYWYPWVCPPPQCNEADIRVIKTVSNPNPQDGEDITYTIEVTNLGPQNASGVEVTDIIPAGLDFLSAAASQGTYDPLTGKWLVGDLASGASAALTISVHVNVGNALTAIDLGPAEGFNVFVLNDISQPSSDTQGKMAVGRSASLSNYSVGDVLPPSGGTVDVLIVGNNLTYTSGAVYSGNVVYGNSTNLPIPSVSIIDGTLRQDSVIDFEAAGTYLNDLSVQLSAKTVNGTTTFQWGSLNLSGTDPFFNVFSVSGTDLSAANNFSINVPVGSVALVNITGTAVQWSGGLTVGGASINNVLYNFYQAENLQINNIDVRGSILAPKANVNFISGVQNGQMIAKNITGMGQFNNTLFVGNIPVDTSIVNVARVTASYPQDPNPLNNESQVVINVEGTGSGNGTGGWQYVGTFGIDEIVWTMINDLQGNLLAGTLSGRIYRSINGGLNWTHINTNMWAGYIWALAVNSTGTLLAGTSQGIFTSTDNGTSWYLTGLIGKDVRSITIDPTGNLFAGTWGFGVFKSVDNGNSWNEVNNGLSSLIVNALAANTYSEVFAGTVGSGVSSTTNGGTNWSGTSMGYNLIWSMGVTSSNLLFAGTYGDGLYRSSDNGASWLKVSGLPGLYIYSIIIDNNDNVYISSWESGVYMTTDGGDSWRNLGLSGYGVSSILMSNNDILYAAASDGRIYKNNSPTSVKNSEEIPLEFNLDQNYPNPFNPSTIIHFSIAKKEFVSLKVYNILGQEVRDLVYEELNPGHYSITFKGDDLASGVYIYRFISNSLNISKKMILQK